MRAFTISATLCTDTWPHESKIALHHATSTLAFLASGSCVIKRDGRNVQPKMQALVQ